jgi:uncharacterized LabA/DUF88 family protein
MRDPSERVALFLDGANVSATVFGLGFEIDYKKLLDYFDGANAFFYTAVRPSEEGAGMRRFVTYLEGCGMTVVTKPAKEFVNDAGEVRVKGNMDIEMAVDMVEKAEELGLTHVILFSGDSDFCYPVKKLQDKGIKVTVVSSTTTTPPALSAELRQQASEYISYHALRPHIERIKEAA